MKTKTLLTGLALSPWLMFPAQAEEPPDDTVVQETLAELGSRGLERLPDPSTPTDPGNFTEPVAVSQLLEAEVWIKSNRLSLSGVNVYELNRELVNANPGSTAGPTIAGELNLPAGYASGTKYNTFQELGDLAEYREVVEVELGGKKARFTRVIPPDELAKLRAQAEANPGSAPYQLADLARLQAAGSLKLGAMLADAAKNTPLAPLMSNRPDDNHLAQLFFSDGEQCFSYLEAMRATDMMLASESGLPQAEIEPWTSINPMTFMTGQACFLLAGANALESLGSGPTETAQQLASEIERAKQALKYQGTDSVDGRPTHKIAVEGVGGQLSGDSQHAAGSAASGDQRATYSYQTVSVQQSAGDPQMEITALYRWIDAEYLVPRKLRIEGIMHAEGQSREFFLEKVEQDYRNVPDSHLYESYRTVLRMGGMLTPSQQAEMRESQGKLEEFERRMASMSASERAMMQRMMGNKIEQWRSLANGGAVEFEIITTSIVINPDFSASGASITPPAEPAPATTTALSPEDLRAAQLACLQERAEAARQAEQKKRGLSRFMGAVSRTAASIGNSSIARAAGDLFSAGTTADDLVTAAEELGLTEDDAAACQNP